MPKNKGKGGKKFRRGKHTNETDRTLLLCDKEENQCYGLVTKTLGNGRFDVNCYEQDENKNFIMTARQCLVRGNMRKKVWVNVNDLVSKMNEDKKKERTNSLVLGAAAVSAVTVFGIILTL